MSEPSPQRASALAALRSLLVIKAASNAARSALLAVDDNVWRDFYAIPGSVEDAMVKLIDVVFGADGLAEYFLYEAMNMKGGGSIQFDGCKTIKIRTIDDVEEILRERYPEPRP